MSETTNTQPPAPEYALLRELRSLRRAVNRKYISVRRRQRRHHRRISRVEKCVPGIETAVKVIALTSVVSAATFILLLTRQWPDLVPTILGWVFSAFRGAR